LPLPTRWRSGRRSPLPCGYLRDALESPIALSGLTVSVSPVALRGAGGKDAIVMAIEVDGRALTFTIVATAAAGLLAGLAPGVQASKPNVTADLRGEAARLSPGAGRGWTLRDALVAGQIAVTALLLVVAALLTRSLVAAERTDPGFAVNHLAVVSTDTNMLQYNEQRSRQFFLDAVARIRAIPGVESAALATRVPLQVNVNTWEIWIPGRHRALKEGGRARGAQGAARERAANRTREGRGRTPEWTPRPG